MNTDKMVRTIYHAEHYAMAWEDFYAHLPLDTDEIIKAVRIASADGDFRGLGKFQSALDERIYDATLDGWYEECGESQYDGHHVLVPFSEDDMVEFGILGLVSEFTHVPVGCIVTSLNSGAVDVTYYDTGAELDKAWAECEAESNNYSQEGDGYLGCERGKWYCNLEGVIGQFDDRREAEFMLYLECHKQGYFPNCWEVNDHGNETLLFDSTEKIRDMLKDYVEFRDEEEAQAG